MLLGMIPRLIGWQLMVVWEDDRAGEEGWKVRQKLRGGGGEKVEGWWDRGTYLHSTLNFIGMN